MVRQTWYIELVSLHVTLGEGGGGGGGILVKSEQKLICAVCA